MKKIALVTLAYKEELYIQEWIDYNLKLGYDDIFIFKNNWDWVGPEPNDRVHVLDYNGETYMSEEPLWVRNIQAKCFTDFGRNYYNEYEWAAFFDIDEFLVLKKHNDVKDFIKDYDNHECVIINWAMFGDNNIETFDESYTSQLNRFTKRKRELHTQFKSICKTSPNLEHQIHWSNGPWVDTHFRVGNGPFNYYASDEIAQLNHYYIRTFPEFLTKREKGAVDTKTLKPMETFVECNFNEVEDTFARDFFNSNDKKDFIKIITIFDKNEDFIEPQYNSITKHIKCEYEYILFNNGSTLEQIEKIDNICKKLNIKTIKLNSGITLFNLNDPSIKAGSALNETFSQLSGKVFKIDSDMFFINDINLLELKEDILYIRTPPMPGSIWSGVFGINLDKVTDKLEFLPRIGDTFSESVHLIENENYTKKQFYFLHYEYNENDKFFIALNGCCPISLDENIISLVRPTYESNEHLSNFINNSLGDHKTLYEKSVKINSYLKEYNFPCEGVTNHNRNYDVDFMVIDNVEYLIHFKSSNWTPEDKYMDDKKISLFNFLKNNK